MARSYILQAIAFLRMGRASSAFVSLTEALRMANSERDAKHLRSIILSEMNRLRPLLCR